MTATIPQLDRQAALAFWRERIALPDAEFYALADSYRNRAFTVSGLQRIGQVRTMQASIDRAIATGRTFEQWKGDVGTLFDDAGWTGPDASRLHTIYTNNVQAAFHAGRWERAQEEREEKPYGQYFTQADELVRPAHRPQHLLVYPLDHSYWLTWWPPNGHN